MAKSPSRLLRWLGWGALAGLLALVLAIVVGRAALTSYLRSERFRSFLAQRIGATLRAEVQVAPLSFTGLDFYGEGCTAQGGPGAAFRELRVEGVRAELSLRRILERVWQVDALHAERVQLSLEAPPSAAAASSASSAPSAPAAPAAVALPAGWLPNRVEIARAEVRDVQLRWPGGGLSGLAAECRPEEGGWKIAGTGGRVEQRGQPPLEVHTVRLLYRPGTLFVQSAELRPTGGGTIQLSGEVQTARALQLHATFAGLGLTPLLGEDWRVRLRGRAAGELDIRSPLPSRGAPELRGRVHLTEGELEALPVLDQIALFTRTQQFRRLKLTRAEAEFTQQGERLEVRDLVVESAQLIRVEGRFTTEHGTIDGTFQVGVTATSLQWLPGSQERVFTTARDGYLWAPMRLTGPLGSPQDDLTARLATAAGQAVLDAAQGTAQDALKTGRDVLKGALDLLLPAPK